MHLCDIETIERIAAYAPHMLTAEDRRALRMHQAAPKVRRVSLGAALACCAALAALPALPMMWGL